MAHGYPDYGLGAAISQLYSVLDLGELAVRLGGHSIVDRRGLTVLQDSFANGIGEWATSATDVGDSVSLLAPVGHSDGYCAYARAAGGASNGCTLTRFGLYPASGRFGFEVAFKPSTWLEHAGAAFTWALAGTCYSLEWSLDGVNNTLVVAGVTGGPVTIVANTTRVINWAYWSVIKLVLDVVTGRPVRVLVNGVTYSLAAYTLAPQSDLGYDEYRIHLEHASVVGHIADVYWDDVLVTLNEP